MPRLQHCFRLIASLLALLVPFELAAQGREIVVGQVAPFSGPQAVTGKAIHAGIKLYLDHVNAQGGIRGMPVRLVMRDDAQKPEQTVSLTRELIRQEAPVALIGTVGTNNIEAMIADGVLTRSGVALVGAVSGASGVIAGRNVFVVKASYHDEVNRLFRSLAGLNMKRVGIVFQDDGFGHDVVAGAEAAAARHAISLIERAGYERNTLKVEQAVESMLQARPQVVFLGATTAAAIEFVRQYRERGGDATVYGLSVIDTGQLLAKLGPQGARGYAFSAVLPLETQRTLEVNREYLRLREQSSDPDLSARSIEGFIAARTLVHALRGGAGSGAPTASTVLASVQGMRRVDLGGYLVDFSQPGRPGSNHVDFAMLGEGGRIVH